MQNRLRCLNMDCGSRGANTEPKLVSPSGSMLLVPMLILLCFLMDPTEEQKGCTSSTRYVAQFILWFCLGFCDPFCMLGRTQSVQCALSGEGCKERLRL